MLFYMHCVVLLHCVIRFYLKAYNHTAPPIPIEGECCKKMLHILLFYSMMRTAFWKQIYFEHCVMQSNKKKKKLLTKLQKYIPSLL